MKLRVFVDESGGSSPTNPVFIVAVVVVESDHFEAFNQAILRLESESGRGTKKWTQSRMPGRLAYLDGLQNLATTGAFFYWRAYPDALHADRKTAEVVAAAIRTRDPQDVSQRVIVIDGLSNASRDRVTDVLKHLNVHRRQVTGDRDEASPCLRLCDSLAGFLRHRHGQEPYAERLWRDVQFYFTYV